MKFSLNETESKKLIALFDQHENNIDYLLYIKGVVYSGSLVSDSSSLLNKNDFEKKNIAFDKLEQYNPISNGFVKENIRWDTSLFKTDYFLSNPYLKTINDLSFSKDNWSLSKSTIKAYSLWPYQEEYAFGANYALKMSLGLFDKDYSYPSISLYDTEWMSLNPHEIRTMEVPIALAKGKVLTLGLGLGYFAFMASNKKEVKEVHIVEMDLELIRLFSDYLLPLFPQKEKIFIHKADAFYFINNVKDKDFDYIFSDLWHNVSDGVPAYLKLKKHFNSFKSTQCTYWIEGSLLSYLRLLVIGVMKDEYYQNEYDYDELQMFIKNKLSDYQIKNSNDIDALLNLNGLNRLFFN